VGADGVEYSFLFFFLAKVNFLKKKRKIDPQSVISFVAKIRHFAFFF
jgi:hypothetical protein